MILSGKARLAGVIGWPVGHSRSPRLHGYWLDHHGIDGAYVPLPVQSGHFAAVLRALPQMGFVGANVTVPHKEAALGLVDHVEPLAGRIGAVNTLVVRADGSLEGRNTDAFGFIENLRRQAAGFRAAAGPAVVVGAGGAARAVVAALIDHGVPSLRLINRTAERAVELARRLGGTTPIEVVAWQERTAALAGAALLVNTTTLGMAGQLPLALDLVELPVDAVVTDIVYAPLETDLLQRARQRGNVAVDGLGMLLHQARPAFQAWWGVLPDVTPELRAAVEATIV